MTCGNSLLASPCFKKPEEQMRFARIAMGDPSELMADYWYGKRWGRHPWMPDLLMKQAEPFARRLIWC